MEKGKKSSRFTRVAGWLIAAAGVILLAGPYAGDLYFRIKTSEKISEFENASGRTQTPDTDMADYEKKTVPGKDAPAASAKDSDPLYAQMTAYNRRISEEGQSGMADLESFGDLPEELGQLEGEVIGCIDIPSINVKLPLYAGATEENMDAGAAVLADTSMPVGGINTNCVIAGHRGWKNSRYFMDIEEISEGDSIYVTNLWETMEYTVTGHEIINPLNADAIKIQEGKDLVTLLTCHPYMSNGRYRYIVFCERTDTGAGDSGSDSGTDTEADMAGIKVTDKGEAQMTGSSAETIKHERVLRAAAAVCAVAVFAAETVYCLAGHKKRSEKKHGKMEKAA